MTLYPRYLSFFQRLLSALLSILALLTVVPFAQAQISIAGKPGLIYTPTARVLKEGTFYIGYAFNPRDYAFRFNGRNSESITFVNLVVLPRLEVNFNLLNVNGPIQFTDKGIGDRQLDIKYAFLTEKKKRPSAAIILSAPFGIDNSMVTYALVASKNFSLSKSLSLEATAGTGSPWYINRDVQNLRNKNIFQGFIIRRKGDSNKSYKNYLSGPYAGLLLRINNRGGFMAEWDSQYLNAGAYVTLWKRWTLQAGLLNGHQLTFGTSYSVSLLPTPKPLVHATP